MRSFSHSLLLRKQLSSCSINRSRACLACRSYSSSSQQDQEVSQSPLSRLKTHEHVPQELPRTELADDVIQHQFDKKMTQNVVRVDKIGFVGKTYTPKAAGDADTTGAAAVKEQESPLAAELIAKIKGAGPISVASFMHEALLHPKYGYYVTGGKSSANKQQQQATDEAIFGAKGDFITSPEISQMFGEMIGLWCVGMWQKMGKPKGVRIVELGPGRGTLMHDMLYATRPREGATDEQSQEFSEFFGSLVGVHMIEASPELRKVQRSALEKQKPSQFAKQTAAAAATTDIARTFGGLQVHWHNEFTEIPSDGPVIVIAHEFLDALPVYQFQYMQDRGWCEVLVDVDDDPASPQLFKFVLAPAKTMASVFLKLTEAPRVVGTRAEVCPLALAAAEQIAVRISQTGGAALLMDYGEASITDFTLQGIKKHAFVHPLSLPGEVDLSAYVDFGAIKSCVSRYERELEQQRSSSKELRIRSLQDVACYGPVTQRDFLHEMGIDMRLTSLLKNPRIDDAHVEQLFAAYDKLTSNADMGKRFKAMVICQKKLEDDEPPTGFEYAPEVVPQSKSAHQNIPLPFATQEQSQENKE